jgi:hypothetical protein
VSYLSRHSGGWRGLLLSAIWLAPFLSAAPDAWAVVLYSSADRNLTPPTTDQGLAAWNLEATWGSFLATPIDATHFIAAAHVGDAGGSQITFQGTNYSVNTSSEATDAGSDLCIWTLASGTFPTWAPLYNAAVDGSEVGKSMIVIGRGTQRGTAVTTADGALKGWQWGNGDGLESWGQNTVTGFTGYNSVSASSMLYFDFGPANDAALSVGDSSGGVFIESNGQWKLAGVNYGVDSPWSLTGAASDPGFDADIFDARGLYYKGQNNQWTLYPPDAPLACGDSYASRVSDRLGWVESVVPDVDAVPEPSVMAMLVTAAAILLLRRFARR